MSTGVTGVKKVDRLREHKRVLHFGSEVSNTMRTHQRGQNRVTRGHVGSLQVKYKRRLYLHRKGIFRNQIFRSEYHLHLVRCQFQARSLSDRGHIPRDV